MTSVVLAKALYNNDSEADDELSFKKGDVITVLETDFEGMVGWWLCSLGDKQGVAPGNRLQLISYGGDDEEINGSDEIYDTPGKAHKKKYGDVDYDVPIAYKMSSEYQDYAIPKSSSGDLPDSQRHGFVLQSPQGVGTFDIRNSNSSDGLATNEVYDAPSRWSSERSSDEFRLSSEGYQESGPEEMYDVPSRNSMESDDGGRAQPNVNRNVPVLPPKARVIDKGYPGNNDQFQGSQEIYDSPASVKQDNEIQPRYSEGDVYDKPPLPNNDSEKLTGLLRSLSTDDTNGIYNTIPNEIYDVPPAAPEDIYDVPPGDSSQSFYNSINTPADGNNNPPFAYCEETDGSGPNIPDDTIYDVPPENAVQGGVYDNFEIAELEKEMKVEPRQEIGLSQRNGSSLGSSKGNMKLGKTRSNESDDYVDYQEIYGSGQDEPEKTKAGKERESEHASVLERIHMEKVRELRISRAVAMSNLDKLQQAVDVAVTKLLSFVTEDWRLPEVLALNIEGIREISGKVKVALRLLTEFGLGALVNAEKLPENGASRNIREALEPLLETYYSIKSAIQHLDGTDWESAYQMRDDDELYSIVKMAQEIPCDAYNLGAVISNISTFLFSRNSEQSDPGSASQSPVTVQKQSIRGMEAKMVASEPVDVQAKQVMVPNVVKAPPKISPKPKKDKKQAKNAGSETSLSENVSELTNNLLNQIEDMKQPSPRFRRQGSKKLSPKTVRRLCSIGLRNEEKNSEKIFEDVASTPPKPSRQCSSPATTNDSGDSSMFATKSHLSGALSDPGFSRLSECGSDKMSLRNENRSQESIQRLDSFVGRMDSELGGLKEGMKSFVESVRQCQKPKVFVAHSKFIVLCAHKLVYIGDGASRTQTNVDLRKKIVAVTNSLSEVINDFVENIKIAARQYPEEAAMNTMIKSVAKVTEKALELYKTLKDHAES